MDELCALFVNPLFVSSNIRHPNHYKKAYVELLPAAFHNIGPIDDNSSPEQYCMYHISQMTFKT